MQSVIRLRFRVSHAYQVELWQVVSDRESVDADDGKKLAGERRLEDGTAAGIVIYSFDSGKFERLTDLGWYPCWLSDSVRLLFQHKGRLYLVDSRSQKQHEVLSLAPQEVAPYRFAISRNDRRIYFGV